MVLVTDRSPSSWSLRSSPLRTALELLASLMISSFSPRSSSARGSTPYLLQDGWKALQPPQWHHRGWFCHPPLEIWLLPGVSSLSGRAQSTPPATSWSTSPAWSPTTSGWRASSSTFTATSLWGASPQPVFSKLAFLVVESLHREPSQKLKQVLYYLLEAANALI